MYSSLSFTNRSPTPRRSGAAVTATVGENVLSKNISLVSQRRACCLCLTEKRPWDFEGEMILCPTRDTLVAE